VSAISERLRTAVAARAAHICEYCRLPQQDQVARFPVDHVVPRSRGGATELDNLALACPHCNALKWSHIEWPDPETGAAAPLFNPGTQVWEELFAWAESPRFELVGKTASGRARDIVNSCG
jgi:5-methylcytosine-specific restriction endonuclease McrA